MGVGRPDSPEVLQLPMMTNPERNAACQRICRKLGSAA
jgi:hypothetical protein